MPNDCHFWDGRTWQGWGQLANVLVTRRITGVPISSFHSAGMPHRGFHGGVVMSRCDVARSSQCFRDTSRTSSTGGSPGFRLGCSSIFRLPLSILHPPPNESASSALLLCHRHRYFIEFVLLLPASLLPPPPSSSHILMLLPHRRYGRFRGEFVSSYQLIYVVIINMGMDPFTSYFDVHQGYKVLTHCHISKISKVNICPYSCGIGSLLQTRHAQVKRTPSAWRRCRSVKHRYIVERPGWESIIRGPEMFAA